MLPCAGVVSVPVMKFADARLPRLALPDDILPVTASADNIPTEVILGCAAVVMVPPT